MKRACRWVVCSILAGSAPPLHAAAKEFDLVLKDGRVIDGTGAPWYIGDVAVRDGRIVRIGKIDGTEADRVIECEGLIVAPGFIDMMGQTATPMLDDPKTAINLLTQGITTINAGEGASAAPIAGEEAASRGWRTMGEYLQLLDLAGLPVNVVQSVGHTQVRRLVMGESERKPGAAELKKMQDLVREAMESGAIGVSTALIYPPAVYAGTDEIAALASVAGEYGGRYYTHMRNEGDRLLEAIDEALEIGRRAKTPVHIFHLKAAGRRNWKTMDEAVARIVNARAAGEQVTADIYPYINNGLGLGSFIHPRHYTDGREQLIARLDEPELRATIRKELEAPSDDWENWFQHAGRDWDKVVIGRAGGIRFKGQSGKSLAAIAQHFKADPWDIFFELVKVEAFALPETMSEENKERLVGEPFISFCTDVGPAGGAGSASHPRAFGSFPRLLSKYVRERKAGSLERVVAQASAVAANDVFVFDRGRISEGLAADIIVFDEQEVVDRADFANPRRLSEGMRWVIVNGMVVLDDKGEMTGARSGRVLRGPGYRLAPADVSTGETAPEFAPIDNAIREFMREKRVPGASLAITDRGRLVYARGFGYADIAERRKVMPGDLFRIASISKPITAVAIMQLVEDGKLKLDDRIFSLLEGYKPVPEDAAIDARMGDITIRHCLQHRGGWDRDMSFDAMFQSRRFAQSLHLPSPAGQDAIIRNMLAQPLDFDPGQRFAYSNYGYCLLGRVIEKLSGDSYETYVKKHVFAPLGAERPRVSGSDPGQYFPDEVRFYSPNRGASVFDDSDSGIDRLPQPYGAWHLAAMDSHGGWVASAVDLARFAAAFDGPGKNPLLKPESVEAMFERPPGLAGHKQDGVAKDTYYSFGWNNLPLRGGEDGAVIHTHTGSLSGTAAVIILRPDRRHCVVLFNARRSPRASHFGEAIRPILMEAIDSVSEWPDIDRFGNRGGDPQ